MSKIYAGNLPFSVDEDKLREMFSPFGAVEDVTVIRDRDSGRSRGFGFVQMPDAEAQTAIEGLNGQDSDGRTLRISEARPREQRPRQQRW
ncbi:MAG: RNA-binding protein [Gammaproteobacteria bacterium]|nr:RNA-binding protein [Gammaproteobacteria bacterium]MDH3767645.1 RNA-binding protein [Gammaproteobacteria bacterium]